VIVINEHEDLAELQIELENEVKEVVEMKEIVELVIEAVQHEMKDQMKRRKSIT
jgi:20S proteasome alpha/beta subunit